MLRKYLFLGFFFSFIAIWSIDDLNSKNVYSEYTKSYTSENYHAIYSDLLSHDTYSFPLQSPIYYNLTKTLSNYFFSTSKKQSLLHYQEKHKVVEGHVLGGTEYYRNNQSESFFYPYYGFEVKAHYKNLSIAGKWFKGHTSERSPYSENFQLINSWVQRDDDVIYIDKIKGEIKYDFPEFGYISLKRDKLNIASNIGGSIILNDEKTNDYTFLNYHFNFGDFSLDFAHASLIADSIATSSKTFSKLDAPDKYLAIHRFAWRPNKNLLLFVGEEIFYGNRNIDYNYFLPIGFWRITEHNLADRDNVLIFGGVDASFRDDFHFYTNVIFDELSKSRIFTSWWGNKYAIQTGLMQEKLFSSPLVSWQKLALEFTAIRPWIYTHKYIQCKSSNDNEPLGFADGSNLLKYSLENSLSFFSNSLSWVVNASYMRQGSEGNNYSLNYAYEIEDTDNAKASWLEGDITDTYTLKQELDLSFLYSHRLKFSYEIIKERGAETSSEIAISYQTRF